MSQLYPFTDPVVASQHGVHQIVSGEGCRVTDKSGKTYIDAVSALWCSSLGFNPERVCEAAKRQMRELAYYHSFMGRTPEITELLTERLLEKLPNKMSHIFFSTSGSEAVESAAKLTRFYQNSRGKSQKMRIISREGAYHGSGQLGAALTAMSYCHDGFGVPLDAVLRTGKPSFFHDAEPGEDEIAFSKRRARELDELIRKEDAGTIGAFIGEPAMGAGGVLLPPDGYWQEIQNVLAKHDILLIADEIITGFGRTGKWFACETYDIQPDMMTLAKQMTASVFPMSAVAISNAVHDSISSLAHEYETLGHGMTYGGHPVGAAIALECLDIYEEMNLPDLVSQKSALMAHHLDSISLLPAVADTRIQGMLACVEMEPDFCIGGNFSNLVKEEAERRGVFFRQIGNVLAIAPPYICTDEEIAEIMETMSRSIISAASNMKDFALAGE